ncbi:hypothetical protein GIB67_028717, partial [Kingdonia uniflora]
LMLFGLLSLLMGHWTFWVSKICFKSSALGSRFYPCTVESYRSVTEKHILGSVRSLNRTILLEEAKIRRHDYCPEGHEPFASYESLEQLHRLLFVLGVIHVSYNFVTIALAMLKIYSWRTWEIQAPSVITQGLQDSSKGSSGVDRNNIRRMSTFIYHRTSHPWSQNKVLVWIVSPDLCFSRQFWSSINRADYMALRLGFISNHELHMSYDFHSYMLRSLEDEFRDIVGISVPLWIYAILCIFINIHGLGMISKVVLIVWRHIPGTNAYFWLSFIPAFLILLVGTKLHHVVLKLALDVMGTNPSTGNQFNLRDELFWLGKPKLLLWLIQIISFQNAFEMATFIWSLWEIRAPSCFMENRAFLIIRLTSGIIFQFWCSYITFPLYVIIAQLGSKFKKSVVTESVRQSLRGWHKRARKRRERDDASITSVTSVDSLVDLYEFSKLDNTASSSTGNTNSSKFEGSSLHHKLYIAPSDVDSCDSHSTGPTYDSSDEEKDIPQLLPPEEDF